jgi:hypothetical protein
MRPSSSSGQSSVEYIAVVALVAIVFAIAGSFTLQGRAIAAATIAQMRRGLCIVDGHDCKDPHPPCSLSSRSTSDDWGADVAVIHLGGGKSAIVEHKSDGQTLVTFTDHVDAGATGGFGVDLKLGHKLAIGGEVRAAALASLGHGTTYRVADERTADELIRTMNLERTDPKFWQGLQTLAPRVSPPVAKYRQVDITGSANLKFLKGAVGGGGREDLLTGKKTVYLKGSVSLNAEGEIGDAGGSLEGKIALTLDRHNRPVDLMLVGTGNLHASSDLPQLLQPIAGHLPSGSDRTWQAEAHLDLTEPGHWEAVRGSLLNPQRLVRMFTDEGSIEVNTYANDQDSSTIGGHAKLGIAVGGEVSHTTSSQRLVGALEHTREGFWVPRYDCLAAAA